MADLVPLAEQSRAMAHQAVEKRAREVSAPAGAVTVESATSQAAHSRTNQPVLIQEAIGSRRAVITGLGVISPGAIGVKEYWSLLAEGQDGDEGDLHFDPSASAPRMAGRSTSIR